MDHLGTAGKLRRYQFALFSCAFKNRAADGRFDRRRVELSLGIVHLALRLQHIGPGPLNLLAAQTILDIQTFARGIRPLLGSVVAGAGIVERLFGNYSLSEQISHSLEIDLVIGGGGASLGKIVLRLLTSSGREPCSISDSRALALS